MDSPKKIVDAIGAELQYVGKYCFGEEFVDKHDIGTRYVWVPDNIAGTEADEVGEGDDMPRPVKRLNSTFDVHMFGPTFDDVYAMYVAAIQATSVMVQGVRYEVGVAEFSQRSTMSRGWQCVAPVTLALAMPEVEYPDDATSDPPSTSVTEKRTERFDGEPGDPDSSGAVAGDGTYQAGET